MYALVDCNNFYASCERLFRPDLEGQPIIVLSNNDGCVVARSNEAKKLDILMGQPYFECERIVKEHGVRVFSSNFALYGDISRRVMTVLAREVPDIEIYSIDEAFLEVSHWGDPASQARRLVDIVRREVGIPVSVGIAATKTLAKLANDYAKKHPRESRGVHDLSRVSSEGLYDFLRQTPVEDIWGVGRESARKLYIAQVKTAHDYIMWSETKVRDLLHVPGVRMQAELRGTSVYGMDERPDIQHSIMSTRSFGQMISDLTQLSEAVASYTARAAEKLRSQGLIAREITVFVRTNRFRKDDPQYGASLRVSLDQATDDTITLTRAALDALTAIYRSGYQYKKAGIILYSLTERDDVQAGLYADPVLLERRSRTMRAVDALTHKHGRAMIHLAAEGLVKLWSMKSQLRSPAYTTKWRELRRVR